MKHPLYEDLDRQGLIDHSKPSPQLPIVTQEVRRLKKYVVVIDGQFLYYCGGDWGPDWLPSGDLMEATIFTDESDARDKAHHYFGGREEAKDRYLIQVVYENTVRSTKG